jgi:hypothetical protein
MLTGSSSGVADLKLRTEQTFTTASESRAERLLAEYLRLWGLRDPSTIAKHCHHWVRQASATSNARATPDWSLGDLYRATVQHAIIDIDGWMDQLAATIAVHPGEMDSRRGLLAIELQTLIDRYPASLLEPDSLPPAAMLQLTRAARPVVPVARRTSMPAQPLGELPAVLQLRWWLSPLVTLANGCAKLFGLRRAPTVNAYE